jgi:hypothetical protein
MYQYKRNNRISTDEYFDLFKEMKNNESTNDYHSIITDF